MQLDDLPDTVWDKGIDDSSIRILDTHHPGYVYHITSNSLFAPTAPISCLLRYLKGDQSALSPLTPDQLSTALSQWIMLKRNIEVRPKIDDLDIGISQLAISPTLKCNLNCTYCYNYQENAPSLIRKLPSLSKDGVGKIIRTLSQLKVDNRVNIAFIGGEPLLNIDQLEYLIRVAKIYAKRRKTRVNFLVTTNGLTLGRARVVEAINKNNIAVSVSVDGPPEWHDEARLNLKGGGSYDRLSGALEYFFKHSRSQLRSARATYRLKPGRMLGTYRHLKSIGFNDIAMGSSDFDNTLLDAQTKSLIFQEIESLVAEVRDDMVSGRVLRHSLLTEAFINLYIGNAKQVICGATRNHVAFDVFGGMQACHRYLGNTEYELSPADIINRLESTLVNEVTKNGKTPHCHKCWARSLCGGECFHVAKEIRKKEDMVSIELQMCDFKRKYFDEALKAYIHVMQTAPDVMPKLVYG